MLGRDQIKEAIGIEPYFEDESGEITEQIVSIIEKSNPMAI